MRHRIAAMTAVLMATVLPGAALASASGARADAGSQAGAGPAWNQRAVSGIEATVRAHAPIFPHRTCKITDPRYASGVRQVTDGENSPAASVVWYYGDAINAAIADCHQRGGGVVEVPATGSLNGGGVWYSGAITLLSGVDLQIDTGATVKFVRNPDNAFYPPVLTSWQGVDVYNYSPLVYALNARNIALTGGGTLDAQDNVGGGWTLPPAQPGAPSGTFDALNGLNAAGAPAVQRIFTDDGHLPATIPVVSGCPPQPRDWGPCQTVRDVPPPAGTHPYASTLLPQFVEFNHSANILVQGVHLVNTLFWEIHPLNSRNVEVRNVSVTDTAHHTDDGIDPESCRDVIISGNAITVLDDGIAVKAGRNRDGRQRRAPSEDILISGNTFDNPAGGGSAAISAGSEMSGGVHDMFAENNTAGGDGLAYLLKLKTNSYRGGAISGIYMRNSTITQTIRGLVNFDTGYAEASPVPDTDVFDPVIRDIHLDNDSAAPSVSTSFPAFVITNAASRSPFGDVTYTNSVFATTAAFPDAFAKPASRFFQDLKIENVRFVNPRTGASASYDTTPLGLAGPATATAGGVTTPLTAASGARPAVTPLPADTFTISGTVNLAADPGFLSSGGSVALYVDRDTTPVPVTVSPDGSFTSAPITLNNDAYWYAGHHYVSVNLSDGIDLSTTVYQVSVPAA